MHKWGHFGVNALLYAAILPFVDNRWSTTVVVLGAVVAIGLANFPDVDEPFRWGTHRGFTHTLWFAIVVGIVVGGAFGILLEPTWPTLLLGFGLGAGSMLAHVTIDAMTPMGVRPLAPVSERHVTTAWFYSKNRRINIGVFLVGALAFTGVLVRTLL